MTADIAKSMRNSPARAENPERFYGFSATGGTVFELFCYNAEDLFPTQMICGFAFATNLQMLLKTRNSFTMPYCGHILVGVAKDKK